MKNSCYSVLFLFLAINSYGQGWQKMPSMPGGGRDAGVSFTIGNTLYSGGGGKKDFYAYNTQTRTWTKKADLPGVALNRGFGVAFAINAKGYVGLGTDSNVNLLMNDLWEYDPTADHWTQKANFPVGHRDGLGVFVIGNKAYVGGGSDNVYVYSDFVEYDPAADKWTVKSNIPQQGDIFPAMFAIGAYGYTTCGSGASEYSDLFRYDPAADTWEGFSPYPGIAMQAGVSFVLGSKGYVGLGQSSYSTAYTDLYSYDPGADTWTQESSITGKGRAWASAAVIGDTVYIGNGWDLVSSFFTDWWQFTPGASASVSDVAAGEAVPQVNPNPVDRSFNITGAAGGGEIELRDILGRRVYSSDLEAGKRFDIGFLPAGEYLARIVTSSASHILKLTKQ